VESLPPATQGVLRRGQPRHQLVSSTSVLSLPPASSALLGDMCDATPTEPTGCSTKRQRSQSTKGGSAELSQAVLLQSDQEQTESLFPKGALDVNMQQVDLRDKHSWLLTLGEVETVEAAEVLAVNTLAPFILNGKLQPLMRGTEGNKYVINVSAMEGKFYRHKTPNHPHTNMAKAALNMMTRTCAEDLAKHKIFMNSVDTGWINDENPLAKAQEISERHNFQTPIDEIDAAARVIDPILDGFNTGNVPHGKFFKDYALTQW